MGRAQGRDDRKKQVLLCDHEDNEHCGLRFLGQRICLYLMNQGSDIGRRVFGLIGQVRRNDNGMETSFIRGRPFSKAMCSD
jgi:hypothetical protein